MGRGRLGLGRAPVHAGALVRMGLRVDVEPRGDGCEVVTGSYADLHEGTFEDARELVLGTFQRPHERYLDAVGRMLASADASTTGGSDSWLAPIDRANALVVAERHDDLLHGRSAKWSDERLGGLDRVHDAPVAGEVAERVHAFLSAASEGQLRFLRPYEIARARPRPASDAARLARGRARRSARDRLERGVPDLPRPGLERGNARGGRGARPLPGVPGRLRRGPGAQRGDRAAQGGYRALDGHLLRGFARVGRAAGDAVARWRLTLAAESADQVESAPTRGGALRGFSVMAIENRDDGAVELTIERDGPSVRGVQAVEVVTLADFVALFASELPPAGAALGVARRAGPSRARAGPPAARDLEARLGQRRPDALRCEDGPSRDRAAPAREQRGHDHHVEQRRARQAAEDHERHRRLDLAARLAGG